MLASLVTTCFAHTLPARVRMFAAAIGGGIIVTFLPTTQTPAEQCSKSSGALALGRTANQSRTVWLTKTRDGFRIALAPNGAKGIARPEGTNGKTPCVVDPQKEERPAAALKEESEGSGVKGGGNQKEGGNGDDSGHHKGGGNSGKGGGNQGDGGGDDQGSGGKPSAGIPPSDGGGTPPTEGGTPPSDEGGASPVQAGIPTGQAGTP
jgi:hypothetical protein